MSADSPPPEGSPAIPVPRRTRRQRVLLVLGGLFAVLAVTSAAAAVYTRWRIDNIERHDLTLADVGADEPQNYLVVGSDSREVIGTDDPDASGFVGGEDPEAFGQRADVIMVVRVDPLDRSLDVLSLHRDLWVPIAGTGEEQRINSAYALTDGRQHLIDTVEADFGIPIHHYVEVDFRGFEGIVESLDGIPLYFDKPYRDRHSGLVVDAPGCRVLDGPQALAFARSRHLQYQDGRGRWQSDPSGDLGRVSRQQAFLRAVLERAAGEQFDLGDLGDGFTLLNTVSDFVGMDDELDVDFLLALAREFRGFAEEDLETHTLVVEPFTTDGGAAVLRWDPVASEPVLEVFRDGVEQPATTLPLIDPASAPLTVLNGSGTPGQAAEAQSALEAVGFVVAGTDNAPEQAETTTIRYGPGAEAVAMLLASHLEHGATLEAADDLDGSELVLVTGPEFGAVLSEPRPDPAADQPVGSTAPGDAGTGDASSAEDAPDDALLTGVVPGEPPDGVDCRG